MPAEVRPQPRSRRLRRISRALGAVTALTLLFLCAIGELRLPSISRHGQCLVTVSSLHRYPVKSCLGEELRSASVGEGGLVGDRTHAVCLLGRKALTQREVPGLARVTAQLAESGDLRLSAAGAPPLELAAGAGAAGAPTTTASIFGAAITGVDLGDEAAAWVSRAVGQDGCRLLRRADGCERRAVGYHWADLAPVLVVSEESLGELARHAGREVPMSRFRPNIVVAGAGTPHAEDGWRRIRLGSMVLDAVGPCARCGIIEVDQQAAARDGSFSVYGVLAGYRGSMGQVTFGQYFRPVAPATVDVGAEVEVLK